MDVCIFGNPVVIFGIIFTSIDLAFSVSILFLNRIIESGSYDLFLSLSLCSLCDWFEWIGMLVLIESRV